MKIGLERWKWWRHKIFIAHLFVHTFQEEKGGPFLGIALHCFSCVSPRSHAKLTWWRTMATNFPLSVLADPYMPVRTSMLHSGDLHFRGLWARLLHTEGPVVGVGALTSQLCLTRTIPFASGCFLKVSHSEPWYTSWFGFVCQVLFPGTSLQWSRIHCALYPVNQVRSMSTCTSIVLAVPVAGAGSGPKGRLMHFINQEGVGAVEIVEKLKVEIWNIFYCIKLFKKVICE